MSDGTISQDEIDALLAGVDMGGIDSSGIGSSGSAPVNIDKDTVETFLSEQVDTLKSCLDSMTGASFEVGKPVVETLNRDGILKKVPEMVVNVMNDFNAGLVGDHVFVMAPEFAQKLTALINKEENPELDAMALSVVSEVVSQHSGNEITKLSQTGKLDGLAANPAEAVHVPKAMVRFPQNTFLLATYPISVDGGAFSLWEVFSAEVANGIAVALGGGAESAAPASAGLSAAEMQSMTSMGGMNMGAGMNMGGMNPMGNMAGMGNMGNPMQMQQNPAMMNMGGMPMGGMPMGGGMAMGGMPQNVPNVQALQFPNLQQGLTGAEQGNIGLIMDVYMEMTVELGRTKKLIKDILGMGEGTIIELDKLAGEPVDILVNQKPIARGEVVVIDENFGVRVTEILSPMERVTDLH